MNEELLCIAACKDNEDVVDVLLRVTSVDVECLSTVRRSLTMYTSPLGYAAQHGSVRVMRRLLQEDGIGTHTHTHGALDTVR